MSLLLLACTVHAQSNRRSTGARRTQTTAKKPTSRTPAKPAAAGKKSVTNFCPDNKHPHAIDLGLSSGTKWSCCNLDAQIPEEYGGYYAYGEVKEKKTYTIDTYKYQDSNIFSIYGTEKDVAHVKWGGEWIIPKTEQFEELYNECTFEIACFNYVYGGIFTGPNGNTIFLPCGGWRSGINERFPGYRGQNGSYSTSKTRGCGSGYCWVYWISNDGRKGSSKNLKHHGYSIRPVIE